MKAVLFTAAAALVGQGAEAFVAPGASGMVRSAATTTSRVTLAMSTVDPDQYKVSDKEGKVYVVSEVTEDGEESEFKKEFFDHGVISTQESTTSPDANQGPRSYYGLVDGDTFDGGDGQVGCVGDGEDNMEKFDQRSVAAAKQIQGESIGGSESRKRAANAFGTFTGYAESLKNEGMVKKNLEGEDMLAVRRQQLENWRNQQELQASQRAKIQQLDAMTGDDSRASTWKKGARSYMDNLSGGAPAEETSWNSFKPAAADTKSDGTTWSAIKLSGKEKLTGTVMCISSSGRPGYQTIQVKNSVMTFEPFHAEFVGDNLEGFAVEPKTGTLNRRSGEAIPVQVSFKANGPGDARSALLVIETEEDKWLYQIDGRSD